MTARTNNPRSLAWFGVLAPPLAWAIQLLVGYSVTEAGCGRPDSNLWGTGIEPLAAGVVLGCGCMAVLGGLAAIVSWRAVTDERASDQRGVVRFLASSAMLGSLIFLVAICLSGLALIPLNVCSAG